MMIMKFYENVSTRKERGWYIDILFWDDDIKKVDLFNLIFLLCWVYAYI